MCDLRPILTGMLLSSLVAGLLGAPAAQAQHAPAAPGPDRLAACLESASAIRAPGQPGDYVKVEYLDPSADGVPTYEIELRDAGGAEWEFMCDAQEGRIYEIEQEAESASDERFQGGAEVSEEETRATVLGVYDGDIIEVEYEIESSGRPTCEMDVSADGTEWKVEVDAATGEIIEVHVERWEIGVEQDERP